MKTLIKGFCVASLFVASTAFAATPTTGEYGNHCAEGLVQGKQVATDCKINWKDSKSGKTYCFSSEEMKAEFSKNTEENIKKADAAYSKIPTDTHKRAS
jgi:YHS domain-containing protein